MAKKTQSYVLHLVGALLFLSIPIFSSPDLHSGHLTSVVPFRRSFISYILLLCFFYANYIYFIPRLYFTRRRILFFAAITVSYVAIALFPGLLFGNAGYPGPVPAATFSAQADPDSIINFMPMLHGRSIVQFLLVFFLSFLLRINERLNMIQSEKLNTEVSYLKAQINPHFLFNTLNSLYALTLEKSDAAPEAVVKLSSMMRYVVTESNRDVVPLENEIGYIKDYISLQQLRMDGSTPFSFTVTGSTAGKSISPMLLIPFIENAFKYGINPNENASVSIGIAIAPNGLSLHVKNNKVTVAIAPEEKSGLGIENTKLRLEYLYPQKHKLAIFDTNDYFEVKLTLSLP
ncbi:sensor histidine kinase [uncultured Flavobacterium sp.]|uniref:sensor histidine kinase n=1 Tax=uncultured Flavobacterium sp. TaxID=165435 RepID=UPI0025E51257|nr:sensor histidine kinase [uncultured Flavobacterium sp.]